METLKVILLILLVIMIFNFVIFIHELGHFLAAKWRGMHVDRFQIWFGKPIWKKTIGGVQYGLGWLPMGGFVSLPQMASMEGIEGEVSEKHKKDLKRVKPFDKILVAFAGPLFSLFLAFSAALVVWVIGKPDEKLVTTTIGYISETSPAKGLLQVGDKITQVEGNPVDCWVGNNLNSVQGNVILSEGETVEFTVERSGETLEISTPYRLPDVNFLDRTYRTVDINPVARLMVQSMKENSPGAIAGLKKGDFLVSLNGETLSGISQIKDVIKEGAVANFTVLRDGKTLDVSVTPQKPIGLETYLIGVSFDSAVGLENEFKKDLVYPNPIEQLVNNVKMMWLTISKVVSPNNSVSVGDMQGAVGIGHNYYQMLLMEHAINRIVWFTVLLNVNLAVLNLLPLPVLDGGHIVTSFYELIRKKAFPPKVMLVIQNAFILLLLGFMLYVNSKDIYAMGKGVSSGGSVKEIKFSAPVMEALNGSENESK